MVEQSSDCIARAFAGADARDRCPCPDCEEDPDVYTMEGVVSRAVAKTGKNMEDNVKEWVGRAAPNVFPKDRNMKNMLNDKEVHEIFHGWLVLTYARDASTAFVKDPPESVAYKNDLEKTSKLAMEAINTKMSTKETIAASSMQSSLQKKLLALWVAFQKPCPLADTPLDKHAICNCPEGDCKVKLHDFRRFVKVKDPISYRSVQPMNNTRWIEVMAEIGVEVIEEMKIRGTTHRCFVKACYPCEGRGEEDGEQGGPSGGSPSKRQRSA